MLGAAGSTALQQLCISCMRDTVAKEATPLQLLQLLLAIVLSRGLYLLPGWISGCICAMYTMDHLHRYTSLMSGTCLVGCVCHNTADSS